MAKRKKAQEKVLDEVVDELSDKEASDLLAGEALEIGLPPVVKEGKGKSRDPNRLVKIRIPLHLKIKRKEYQPGEHVVPFHMVDTIIEMIHRKQKADLSIFVGKNYLVQKLLDRSLVVKEVDNLDLKQLAR